MYSQTIDFKLLVNAYLWLEDVKEFSSESLYFFVILFKYNFTFTLHIHFHLHLAFRLGAELTCL